MKCTQIWEYYTQITDTHTHTAKSKRYKGYVPRGRESWCCAKRNLCCFCVYIYCLYLSSEYHGVTPLM